MPALYGTKDPRETSAPHTSGSDLLKMVCLAFCISLMSAEILHAQGSFMEDNQAWLKRSESMLLKRQYSDLDKLIAEVRTTKRRNLVGQSILELLYASLSSPPFESKDSLSALQDRRQLLEAWCNEQPSAAAQISLAFCHVKHAWRMRGTGFSETTSLRGRYGMETSTSLAKTAIDSAAELAAAEGIQDWCIPFLKMRIGILAGSDRQEMQRQLGKAFKIDPWSAAPISVMTQYLTPRWYGDSGSLLEFAETWSDSTEHETGDFAYAMVAVYAFAWGEWAEFGPDSYDWPRTRRGLLKWLEQTPDSPLRLGTVAKYAHLAGDRSTARRVIERLEGRWSTQVWKTPLDFQRTIRWAFDDGQSGDSLHVVELGLKHLHCVGLVNEGRDFVSPTSSRDLSIYSTNSGKLSAQRSLWPTSISLVAKQSVGNTTDMV